MKEKYFLGGVTPKGFLTYLGELVNDTMYYTYILKGGPGTGKSSFMKRIAKHFEKRENIVYYYCSSDPDSLDAIELTVSKVIIVDGTAPHVFEPKYPGVCERIINLGEYWNKQELKENSEKIISTINHNKSLMAMASDNHKVLSKACEDRYNFAKDYVDKGKIENAAKDFCAKIFEANRGRKGEKNIRQLSVMTRYGYMTQMDTVDNYSKVFILKDDSFIASDIFIDIVAKRAMEIGYDTVISPCLLFGSFIGEHLLIKELDVAIITSNPMTHINYDADNIIDCQGFYKEDGSIQNEVFLKDNTKRIDELTGKSRQLLNEAKSVHDEIEKYYSSAMNFELVESLFKVVCEEIQEL